MPRLRALAPVLAVAAVAALPSAASVADVVKDCPDLSNQTVGGDIFFGGLSVRNVSCRTGRRLIRQGRLSRTGNILVNGYSCKLIGYYGDGGNYRCTAGNRALRFSAGG